MHSEILGVALLVIAGAFNLVYTVYHVRSHVQPRSINLPHNYTYRGQDYPETLPLPIPDLPLVLMTVEESVHYPPLGEESDDQWFSLTSKSFGYVRLGPEHRAFVVTMFHELHCLRALNFAFSKSPLAPMHHVQHCLNYIRQGVLCAPDLTLEEEDFEQRDFKVDKTGAIHICRDWSAVYPVMNENLDSWRARVS